MNIHAVDWRIEPLHDVIVGIEAGLTIVRERLEDGDDGITAREHAEMLLGLGFVAAQAYVLGTWTNLNRIRESSLSAPITKSDCYASDTITVQAGITRIHVINATANYFKHHDEWRAWPQKETARILATIGITQKTEFPCIRATELLCGRAASRGTIQFHMSSNLQSAATRAPARGSSSCSRYTLSVDDPVARS